MPRPKLQIPPGVTVVSPSQMSVAKRCWRLWGFQYIEGEREPGGRGAAFGNRVHTVHEDYLNHGVAPMLSETWTFRTHLEDIIAERGLSDGAHEAMHLLHTTPDNSLDRQLFPGKVALAMMPQGVYPAPRSGIVEKHFLYKRTPSIWYQGLMDWHLYNRATRRLKVLDHKTSLDPQKYGLVTDAPLEDDPNPRGHLRNDHQCVIYARAGLDEYQDPKGGPQPEGVDMYWSYGKSDGVRKHSYVAEAHYDNVGEVYALFENEVHPWAEEMHRLKQLRAAPLSLDPSPNRCRDFNRMCSHADACNLSTEDKLGALMSATAPNNPLLAKVLSSANAAATPMPPPAAGDAISPPEAHGAVAAVAAPAVGMPAVGPVAAPIAAPAGSPMPAVGPAPVAAVAPTPVTAVAPTPTPAAAVVPVPSGFATPSPAAIQAAVVEAVRVATVAAPPADFWDQVATKVAAALVAKVSGA